MVGVALDARPRAARRTWQGRVSAGHVLMIVAGLLGAVATLAVLRSADHRVDVLVARAALAPGDVVERDDFRAVRVGADDVKVGALVRAEDVDELVGRVVTTRVGAGRFVARDDVEPLAAGAARRSMSFPIERARALDGQLVAGDTVDVIATDERGNARYVATAVDVLRVGGDRGRSPLGGSDALTVTLAVEPDVALQVASALHGDDLTLVRSTGAAR